MKLRRRGKALASGAAQIAAPAAAAGLAPAGRLAEAVTSGAVAAVGLVVQRVVDRQRDVVDRAAATVQWAPEALIHALMGSPEGEELLVRAIDLARLASLEAKRVAIAGALVRGVASDEAAVGESEFLRLLANPRRRTCRGLANLERTAQRRPKGRAPRSLVLPRRRPRHDQSGTEGECVEGPRRPRRPWARPAARRSGSVRAHARRLDADTFRARDIGPL